EGRRGRVIAWHRGRRGQCRRDEFICALRSNGRISDSLMVEPQSSRLWQAAIRSGLLDEGVLRAGWDAIPPEKRTNDAVDRRLARQLVNARKLTLWQAQQLLAGRWQ